MVAYERVDCIIKLIYITNNNNNTSEENVISMSETIFFYLAVICQLKISLCPEKSHLQLKLADFFFFFFFWGGGGGRGWGKQLQ